MDILKILSMLVNADKIGGWVRAGVASLLTIAIAHWAPLGSILTPETQTALGVAAAGIAVGIWSQLTKSDSAKVAAVVALAQDPASPVKGVITEDTTAGRALAASIPGPVVSAGSAAATAIAKST